MISKKLEAFKKIKLGYICGQGAINEFALRENERENFEIIEAALTEFEELRQMEQELGVTFKELCLFLKEGFTIEFNGKNVVAHPKKG